MLKMFTIIGLVIALWLPLMDYGVFRARRKALPGMAPFHWFVRLVYFGFVACVLLMAFSSFGMLAIGDRMHRWMLILHMSVAPAFAVAVTLIAYLWAEQSRITREGDASFYPGEKYAFWITVLAAFMTITSALLGMMTWFGSPGQEFLLNLHRFSAMLLLISTVFHAYRLWVARPATGAPAQS